jgi:hypothetical protein
MTVEPKDPFFFFLNSNAFSGAHSPNHLTTQENDSQIEATRLGFPNLESLKINFRNFNILGTLNPVQNGGYIANTTHTDEKIQNEWEKLATRHCYDGGKETSSISSSSPSIQSPLQSPVQASSLSSNSISLSPPYLSSCFPNLKTLALIFQDLSNERLHHQTVQVKTSCGETSMIRFEIPSEAEILKEMMIHLPSSLTMLSVSRGYFSSTIDTETGWVIGEERLNFVKNPNLRDLTLSGFNHCKPHHLALLPRRMTSLSISGIDFEYNDSEGESGMRNLPKSITFLSIPYSPFITLPHLLHFPNLSYFSAHSNAPSQIGNDRIDDLVSAYQAHQLLLQQSSFGPLIQPINYDDTAF